MIQLYEMQISACLVVFRGAGGDLRLAVAFQRPNESGGFEFQVGVLRVVEQVSGFLDFFPECF